MILLYHLVFPDETPRDTWNAGKLLRLSAFKKQLMWLKKHYAITSLEDYLSSFPDDSHKIAITFDDGYQSTLNQVLPFMQDHALPATFFLNSSHLEEDHLLWFVYINAVCFEKVYDQLEFDSVQHPLRTEKQCHAAWQDLIQRARDSRDPIAFSQELAARYPLPEKITRKYAGVTREQLTILGENRLFEIGGHTHNHPYLDHLDNTLQANEIQKNKRFLEAFTKRTLRFFAYPSGFYNRNSIRAVQQAGYQAALAVIPRSIGPDQFFEMPRTGIYSSSMTKYVLKVSGLVDLARKITTYTGKHD